MINQEKYEKVTWRLVDVIRGENSSNDYRAIMTGVLAILWFAYKNELISDTNASILEDEINKTIDFIEKRDSKLNNILNTLLNNKIQSREVRINIIKVIIKELKVMDTYSDYEIKNILNHIITREDFGKGKSEALLITPEPIKNIMVGLIDPMKNMKVADYFSGSGSILLRINEAYKDYNVTLHGEEINNEDYLISQILLLVNEVTDYTVLNKDVYDLEDTEKNAFDYVLMNGPFSMSSNQELKESKVFCYGVPSKNRMDWAGHQLALYALKENGRAIVTTPTGALFRSSDMKIIKAIVEDDKIEAVIQLPSKLYTNTAIATSIIVFNRNKTSDKKNKIMFIDASNEYVRENRRQNTIPKESIVKIINCINENNEIDGFAIIEGINKISENDYNLNSNVYINNRLIASKLGKTRALSEVADVITGVQLNPEDMEILKKNPTHYYLNVRNIENNEINYDEEDKIRDKKVDWYGKYDIKADDIIITSRGTTIKTAVVADDFKDSFISNNLSIIRIKQNKYDPYVLSKYLNSKIGKLVLENITTGSAIMVMNAKKLNEIEIPDYDNDFLESVGKRIKKNEIEYKSNLKELKRLYKEEDQALIDELGV